MTATNPDGQANAARFRKDRRREIARNAIIDAAEAMFAKFGIDTVSLRQIGAAIGSGNTNVVSYYFGTKEGLVEAIFYDRLEKLESRRIELLRMADEEGRGSNLETLLKCIWLPVFEQKNSTGEHAFAGFLDKIVSSEWRWVTASVSTAAPSVAEIGGRIRQSLPGDLQSMYVDRLQLSSLLVLRTIQICDRMPPEESRRTKEDMFDDSIRMMARAMTTETPGSI